MHIGEYLVAANESDVAVFTPWLARGADNARFTYEEIQMIGSPTFEVVVRHKNTEDLQRDGAAVSVTWSSTGVGNTTFKTGTATGLKELIRFECILQPSSSALEAILYRFLEPTWFNTAG